MYKTIPITSWFAGVALLSLSPFVCTQDMPVPSPAPELERFAPLVGHWNGSGVVRGNQDVGDPWTAKASYKWSHGGFWLQQDFVLEFEGKPNPFASRTYLGWDGERRRYVTVQVANNGQVGLHEVEWLPEGAMMMMVRSRGQFVSFAQRTVLKTDGDTMTYKVDALTWSGSSTTMAEGTFTRAESGEIDALDQAAFGEASDAPMQDILRCVGDYSVVGTMRVSPGTAAMKIRGDDSLRAIYSESLIHGHTDGVAEGMDSKYEADVFWGWDQHRSCYVQVFVSNMGEVGEMELRFAQDRKSLISTGMATFMGQPMVQRMVIGLDEAGRFATGTAMSIMGTAPPFESFNATYSKKEQ